MALITDITFSLPKHPARVWKKRKNVKRIIVHTTGSSNQDPAKTARYHIRPGPQNHISKKGCPGLCYHDFIVDTGRIFHCNLYEDITWHAGFYNSTSVGVVMAFKGQTGASPTAAQFKALKEHLVTLCLYLKVLPKNIIGHRQVPGMFSILGNGSRKYKKTCPGMAIDLKDLRDDVTRRLQTRLASEGLYHGLIDGKFGRKSKAALNTFKPIGKYAK